MSKLRALRSAAATLIVLAAASLVVLPSASVAAPTPAGPLFPAPGGSTVAFTPAEGAAPNNGYIGKTGGSTATYSAFGGTFTHLWFGPDQTTVHGQMPAVALDNAIDAASERLSLNSISGNTATFGAGTTNLKYIVNGTYQTVPVSTRFRMVATRVSDNSAINWVTAATAGVASGVGAVIPVPLSGGVPQSFRVMRIFEACRAGLTQPNVAACNIADANWEPVNTLYDRLNTDPSVSTRSSFASGFYYNRAPTALAQSKTTAEDTATSITLTGSDPDPGASLTFSLVSGPSNGSLTGSGAARTYTPNLNFNGSDSFTFRVNDGFVDSGTATVSITVSPVNDIPVANAQSISTAEDTAADVTLTGSDVETGTLTYEIVTPPASGSVDATNSPLVTYTPNLNVNGADSFTFRAFDGSAYSPPATVSITITPVNDAPEAFDQLTGTPEDTPVDITLGSNDLDGDAVTFSIVDAPAHGTLTGDGPVVHYVPDLNYNGFDAFTYLVNDGALDSNVATVTVEVPPVNDAPIADDAAVSTDEDTTLDLVLGASDVDNINDELTYTIVTPPSSGTLVGTGANVQYVPGTNFNGTDSFQFQVNDGEFDSNLATVTITVNAVNDAPTADAASVATAEDTPLDLVLTGADLDGDAITFTVVDGPDHGQLVGVAPNLAYVPDANYNGPDAFTFVTNDGALDSAPATVSIDVAPVNDAPVADAQAVVTDEDAAIEIVLTGSDIEDSPLTFTVVDEPTHGTLTGAGGTLLYTPFEDYNGTDSFTFLVNDGELDSGLATVSLEIGAVNDAPVAVDDVASTPQYTPVTFDVLGNDSDIDLDTITVASATDGGAGSTTVNEDGTISYAPTPNFKGSDSFTYTIDDGAGGTATATVTILEIGCGEDGLDALAGTPGEGTASRTIDREVEPVIGAHDPDLAATVHANNCAYVVTAENEIDGALGG